MMLLSLIFCTGLVWLLDHSNIIQNLLLYSRAVNSTVNKPVTYRGINDDSGKQPATSPGASASASHLKQSPYELKPLA